MVKDRCCGASGLSNKNSEKYPSGRFYRQNKKDMIDDHRNQMSEKELLEEMELRFPEKLAALESVYCLTIEAIIEDDIVSADPDELDDLVEQLREILSI